MTDLYVQYGCGLTAPKGWENFDASLRLRIERVPGVRLLPGYRALFPHSVRYGDIVSGLPVEEGSAAGVFCSHVLEHLSRRDAETALRNTYNILRPGGRFRIVVPDLSWRVDEYLRTRGAAEAADVLQRRLHLRESAPASGVAARMRSIFGLSLHQWMYDEALLEALLVAAGFVEIRRCTFGDCEDPAFAGVEEKSRFADSDFDELAFECRRPLLDTAAVSNVRRVRRGRGEP